MQICYKIHDCKQHTKRTKSCHDWHTIMNVSPKNYNLSHIKISFCEFVNLWDKLILSQSANMEGGNCELNLIIFILNIVFVSLKTVAATISHIVPRVVEYDLSQDTLEP